MRSKHDMENLAASSVSVPLKTPKTKFELIPPKMQNEIHFKERLLQCKKFPLKGTLKVYWIYLRIRFETF